MKKFIMFALLTSYLAGSGTGQTFYVDKKISFGYNYGTCITKGDFGANNTTKLPMSRLTKNDTTKLNGYAQTGFHYDVYVTYEFIPHLSAMLAVYGDQCNFDINTLNGQFGRLNGYTSSTYDVVTGDNYYVVQYLVGPYVNPRILGSLHFEVKLLVGLTTDNYPGISYIFSPNLPTANYTNYTYPKGYGFGYNFGGGFNYGAVIGPIGLGAHLNIDYEGATVSYSYYNVTHYSPNSIAFQTLNNSKTMGINLIQITLGLSVEL
jgi:hypothetical protein